MVAGRICQGIDDNMGVADACRSQTNSSSDTYFFLATVDNRCANDEKL
jgi:hypothetical protein